MGVLLCQALQLNRDNIEYNLLYGKKDSLEQIRYNQGHIQGILDTLNFCDTLDRAVELKKQQEDRLNKELAGTRHQSQAEVMGIVSEKMQVVK